MHNQAQWKARSLPDLDDAEARVVRPHRSKLEGLLVLARRVGASIVDFQRELNRGWDVMYGRRPPSSG